MSHTLIRHNEFSSPCENFTNEIFSIDHFSTYHGPSNHIFDRPSSSYSVKKPTIGSCYVTYNSWKICCLSCTRVDHSCLGITSVLRVQMMIDMIVDDFMWFGLASQNWITTLVPWLAQSALLPLSVYLCRDGGPGSPTVAIALPQDRRRPPIAAPAPPQQQSVRRGKCQQQPSVGGSPKPR